MMERRLERGKCDDEVSKSVTVRQLPEDENQQVVPAGKTFDIFVALVFLNEPLEVVNGKKIA
jgi:DNA-directed RNA polymerase subunit E'/Rpb7